MLLILRSAIFFKTLLIRGA